MIYCAHIRPEDNAVQSVEEHGYAVSQIGKGYAEYVGAPSIAEIQGLIHDYGKLINAFNEYINGSDKYSKGSIDHSFAGAKYICELADKIDSKRLHDVSRFIARTVISHHGLHDWLDDEGEDCFGKRISKMERYDEIKSNISESDCEKLKLLLKNAASEYESIRNKIRDLSGNKIQAAFYMGFFERFMQSVLIDADRTDTADFMSGHNTEKQFDTEKLWKNMQSAMNRKLESFSGRNDRISVRRRNISDRCAEFAKHKVGICKLVVPTGGGKTLSSLRFAIDYCRNFGMKKIIYVAPFMSILEQNSDEIRAIAGDENFLEHHSDALAEIENENELAEYELRTEKWDTPVIATTMVQFLNALFSGKTSAVRRMHRLSRSVIIIDEAQSVPLKCVNMFNLAMNFLAKICDCAIVLSSATQPVFDCTEFPVIPDESFSMTGDYSEDFEVFCRTEIIAKLNKYGYTYKEAAEFCYDKYKENGNLLVVVNTKSSALELYRDISEMNSNDGGSAEIIHLSTNMCPEHRRDKINEIRTLLNAKKPVICITTQLIEAGVDISFKCVVRSLAGMDNAAQAAGRCNRHGESEKICPVYIINIRDEKLGSLKMIKDAQSISRDIIDNENYNDYLSDEIMGIYFGKLYRDYQNELSYTEKVPKSDKSLINLLSVNESRFFVRRNKECKWHCSQAFKTAGSIFNVIDSNTADVIVPYNDEAEDIILRLGSDINPDETVKLLRKAQKYIVGIYSSTGRKLSENNAVDVLNCGAAILKKEFYNSKYGVTTDGAEMEVLIM